MIRGRVHGRPSRLSPIWSAMVALAILTALAAPAGAAVPAPAWQIDQASEPTYFPPGGVVDVGGGEAPAVAPKYHLTVVNVGGAAAESVVVTDVLPPEVTASPTVPPVYRVPGVGSSPCGSAGQTVTCEIPGSILPGIPISVYIPVDVDANASGTITNEVTVTSANTPPASRLLANTVSSELPPFEFLGTHGLFGAAYTDTGGSPEAGSHPFSVNLAANLPSRTLGSGGFQILTPVDSLRTLGFELPAGMVVNPRASTVRCTQAQLEGGGRFVKGSSVSCPPESQIGRVQFDILGGIPGLIEPLYNMVPPPGVPAEFAFGVANTNVHIRGGLSGTFNLTAKSSEILAKFPIPGIRAELWGVPSDSRHDYARRAVPACQEGCAIDPSPRALLTMPSACSDSLSVEAQATGWLGSEAAGAAEFATADGQIEGVSGCEQLNFKPSLDVSAQSKSPGTPTGLSVDLEVPQNEGTFGSASATVKRVSMELPPGMVVNPGAANGLSACSPAQIGIGGNAPPSCPDGSRIGTAEIVTPLLDAPLSGSVYLAQQQSNPFGTLLALYLVVQGEGVVVKLPGRVDTDPVTGRIVATFDNNPQLPFSDLRVRLTAGLRAPLVTPSRCGTYSTRTELTSWASSTPVVVSSPITLDRDCAVGGFDPGFRAGTTNPVAGRYSPFTLRITRGDGEQNLARVSATLPEGLLAKLVGVPLCGDMEASTGACPPASQIGTTAVGVGAGGQPLYIPQPGKAPTAVHLAGPYKGAPYSIVVEVPAEAGPFDLGLVAVRVALQVDPTTAAVSAVSDPLPQILEGIPIAYRDLRIDVDRQGFIVNPTSCDPMRVTAALTSVDGATAFPGDRFQVAGCDRLAFGPKLSLKLNGSTQRGKNPALRAVLTQASGQANIRRAAVILPKSAFIDNRHINNPCTRVQFNAGSGNGAQCPPKSILGFARAYTPLLDKPLVGPVYFRSNGGERELPDLVASLDGQVHLNLVGFIDSVRTKGTEVSRTRTTFATVPDAAVNKFVLELKGGRNGLIQNSVNLCKATNLATVRFAGQNGKTRSFDQKMGNSCKSKGGK